MELKVELKDKLDNPEELEKYVISFLIIFEMPTLESTEYVDKALPQLCKAMSLLPYSALARICRVWARYCRNSFKNILELLHQLITARVIKNCDGKRHLQDNIDIVSATKVMKVRNGFYSEKVMLGFRFICIALCRSCITPMLWQGRWSRQPIRKMRITIIQKQIQITVCSPIRSCGIRFAHRLCYLKIRWLLSLK